MSSGEGTRLATDEPPPGRILVDGQDLARVSIDGKDHVRLRVDEQEHTVRLVKLTIDGQAVEVPDQKPFYDSGLKRHVLRPRTIYDAAAKLNLDRERRNGHAGEKVDIPIICHREHMTPVAVCRVCVVDLGPGKLVPSCHRQVEEGMKVQTDATSPRVRQSVSMLAELLMSDHPTPCEKQRQHGDCELEALAGRFAVPTPNRLPGPAFERKHDTSSVVIAVDHNACILCDRCVRGCNEVRLNEVIGRRGKGYAAGIAFDLDTPMGDSTCVACGECMISCPTGALTNRGFVVDERLKPSTTGVVPWEELAAHPLFQGVSHPFLQMNEGATRRRVFRKGEVICREGDFGSTAFYIEEGTVEVFIQAPLKHVKGMKDRRRNRVDRGPLGLVRKFTSRLVGRGDDDRAEESTNRYIHIDAPVSLRYDNPVATLEAGDVFGEMTCMSSYPRSATVRAAEDCTLLELERNVLYILQRNIRSKALFEESYRKRAIDNLLRGISIFSDITDDAGEFQRLVDYLRPRVELVRVNPGEVIFRQGEPADHFYLVRIGFVKVSQARRGGEQVLTYLGPGGYFGEIGLMWHIPEVRDRVLAQFPQAAEPVRSATCSALDHVDLVKITGADFGHILQQFPAVREHLVRQAVEHLEDNVRAMRQVENVPLGEFLQQGLMNAQSLLVLDLEKCTRCDECTKACSDAHDGVTRLIREGLRFDKFLVASSCRSCLDPYCMVGCPVGSIRRRNTREIIIEDWCIGCGKCAENCPYGNINMHPFEELRDDPARPGRKVPVLQEKATMCDLCASLDGQPSCVYACPHDAAHRMSGGELLNIVQGGPAA